MMRFLFVLFLLLNLTACINFGGSKSQPVKSYVITATIPQQSVTQAQPLSNTVIVSRGTALPELMTDKMIYQRGSDSAIESYAYHRWVAPPVNLIAPQIAQSISNTYAFKAVILGTMFDAKADNRVNIQLLKLQQNISGNQSKVLLILSISVINATNNSLLASQRFEADIPCATTNAEGMVKAANQALSQLLPQINSFVIKSITKD